ncbi:MAG: cell division protein FtsB [Bermanella sp.]|nr:cell division protein FtsB [Bermanella sp.]|tara:strand:+ start:1717 stop:2028 length:312 start_codon:yes stop_codon:yes gene_type:complete
MALADSMKQHAWKPVALAIFIWLQYQLWFDDTGVLANYALSEQIENQSELNRANEARNQVLEEEIWAIKSGMDTIEAKARKELGMVKKDETFFIIVDPEKQNE